MRWMVIYEYEVPGRALNLSSTKLPRPWSPWGFSPSRENHHVRTGNLTLDLMISSQKLWPLDHEAGHTLNCYSYKRDPFLTILPTTIITMYKNQPDTTWFYHVTFYKDKYSFYIKRQLGRLKLSSLFSLWNTAGCFSLEGLSPGEKI
jgi:hypothetical protein